MRTTTPFSIKLKQVNFKLKYESHIQIEITHVLFRSRIFLTWKWLILIWSSLVFIWLEKVYTSYQNLTSLGVPTRSAPSSLGPLQRQALPRWLFSGEWQRLTWPWCCFWPVSPVCMFPITNASTVMSVDPLAWLEDGIADSHMLDLALTTFYLHYGSFHVKSPKKVPFWSRPPSISTKIGEPIAPHDRNMYAQF